MMLTESLVVLSFQQEARFSKGHGPRQKFRVLLLVKEGHGFVAAICSPIPKFKCVTFESSTLIQNRICLIANLVQLLNTNKTFKVQTIQSFVFSNVSQFLEEYEDVVDKPNNTFWVLS